MSVRCGNCGALFIRAASDNKEQQPSTCSSCPIADFQAQVERLKNDIDILCGVCHRTCEIQHKSRTIEFYPGRFARFHDAYNGDCWTRLTQFILAQDARKARAAPKKKA